MEHTVRNNIFDVSATKHCRQRSKSQTNAIIVLFPTFGCGLLRCEFKHRYVSLTCIMDRKEEILPSSVLKIVELGVLQVNPEKIILFGSRARRTARLTSDFDIAFSFPPDKNGAWLRYLGEIEDSGPSLYSFDFINMQEASESLKQRIGEEGVTLYER